MTLTAHVITDLEWVIGYWPDLTEARLPGTARPWRQPELTPDQRAERDHAARLELADRSQDAWGETPAPVDVGILDLLASLLWDADTIHDHVSRGAGMERLAPPSTAFADARPYLEYAAKHLPAITSPDGEAMLEEIARIARGMKQDIARALCLVYDGQRLDVICIWCDGRTELAPVGGEKTWRVRELPGGLIAIVCESGTCEPPSKDVGTWHRGRPVWPTWDWEFLAGHVKPEVAVVLHKAKVARLPDREDEKRAMDTATAALLSGVTTKDWEARQVTASEPREKIGA